MNVNVIENYFTGDNPKIIPGVPEKSYHFCSYTKEVKKSTNEWDNVKSALEGKVIFGATVSGRPAELPGVETMVGLFINTLPVVVDFSGDETVISWLQNLHEQNKLSDQYHYFPLSEIQQLVPLCVNTPLFDSLIVFENYPMDKAVSNHQRNELSINDVEAEDKTNYGLTLSVIPGFNY